MTSGKATPDNLSAMDLSKNLEPRKQCNKGLHDKMQSSVFQGKCDGLKGSVYDTVARKDTFIKTTKDILRTPAICMGCKVVINITV